MLVEDRIIPMVNPEIKTFIEWIREIEKPTMLFGDIMREKWMKVMREEVFKCYEPVILKYTDGLDSRELDCLNSLRVKKGINFALHLFKTDSDQIFP